MRDNRHVEEGWTRQKGTTKDSHNPDQHLASSFTVLDTIQQMSRKKIRRVEFTLLDELDKEKRNHVVEYAGQTSIPFGEKQADVTRS